MGLGNVRQIGWFRMVQDGSRCVISQDMSGYGGMAVPFNILEPAALRHN